MEVKILTGIALMILIVSSIILSSLSLAGAEIIEVESEPTETHFIVSEDNGNGDDNNGDNGKKKRADNFEDIINKEDIKIEEKLREKKFGEWKCINNLLQREVTHLGNTYIEYGQTCGFTDENKSQISRAEAVFLILNTLLIVAIGFVLILITYIALRR